MTEPDTFFRAAKLAAEKAGIPWAEAQRTYKAMQDGDLLPTSKGRNVYYAHPNLVAEFLIGLADTSGSPVLAYEKFAPLPKQGSDGWGNDFRQQLAMYLTNAEKADVIDHIEFHPDSQTVVIRFKEGAEERWSGNGDDMTHRSIFARSVIKGELVSAIARSVNWVPRGYPPYKGGDPIEGD